MHSLSYKSSSSQRHAAKCVLVAYVVGADALRLEPEFWDFRTLLRTTLREVHLLAEYGKYFSENIYCLSRRSPSHGARYLHKRKEKHSKV